MDLPTHILRDIDRVCTAGGSEPVAGAMDAYENDPASFEHELIKSGVDLGGVSARKALEAWYEWRLDTWSQYAQAHPRGV